MSSAPITNENNAVLAECQAKAEQIITKYVLIAVGCGFIPLPLIDAAAIAGLEIMMIGDLAEVYNFSFPTKLATIKAFASIIGSIGPIYLVTHSKSVIKSLPLIGYLTGSMLYSATNGFAVFAVGKVFQYHFESNGTLLSRDNQFIKNLYEKEYKRGAEIVPHLIKTQDVNTNKN